MSSETQQVQRSDKVSTELIEDPTAVDKLMTRCRAVHDARCQWLIKKKPGVVKTVLTQCLSLLPDICPAFVSPDDRLVFREQIQFETIEALRGSELAVGITLQVASVTRWQWIIERAIGRLVLVVIDEYLS